MEWDTTFNLAQITGMKQQDPGRRWVEMGNPRTRSASPAGRHAAGEEQGVTCTSTKLVTHTFLLG